MHISHIPDVAIAVFHDGKVETDYCSLAPAMPPSPDSVFEAASLSKPVFAAGVLDLVARGKLDLDRPLNSYLHQPYKHEQNPFRPGRLDVVTDPRLGRITARMVLSHISGLPNWSGNKPLTFQNDPGSKWSYSGEGYVYLQRVLETITGVPLDTFMRAAVLQPMGMMHSSFVWDNTVAKALLPGHAASGRTEVEPPFEHPVASSTLYTTLGDYARFVSALLRPGDYPIIALEESQQVVVRQDISLAWGLGVAIEDSGPRAHLHSVLHWGANPGYQSFFLCEPTTGRAALLFTNSDNGLDLVDQVVGDYVPGLHPSLKFPMLHPKD